MRYRIVKQKKGYAVVEVVTEAEVQSHGSLSRAKSFVQKENKAHELRMSWAFPSVKREKGG